MPKPDLHSLKNSSNWQLLAEFSIPSDRGLQSQVAADVTQTLQELHLEPQQSGIILSAVDEAMQSLEEGFLPLHVRISVSGVHLEGKLPLEDQNREQYTENKGRGLSFFLVKRIVGQLPDQESEKYRLLEVLIYRE